jgi:hypothetical protein
MVPVRTVRSCEQAEHRAMRVAGTMCNSWRRAFIGREACLSCCLVRNDCVQVGLVLAEFGELSSSGSVRHAAILTTSVPASAHCGRGVITQAGRSACAGR